MVQWTHCVYVRWKYADAKYFYTFCPTHQKKPLTLSGRVTWQTVFNVQYCSLQKPWNKQSWLTLKAGFFFFQTKITANSEFNGKVESHLKFSAGVADLIDVRQRASVVRRPCLRQTKLLDLLKLHLSVERGDKNKYTTVRKNKFCTCGGNVASRWQLQSSFPLLSLEINAEIRDTDLLFHHTVCFSTFSAFKDPIWIFNPMPFFQKHVLQTMDVDFTCCKVVSLHKQLLQCRNSNRHTLPLLTEYIFRPVCQTTQWIKYSYHLMEHRMQDKNAADLDTT